MRKPRILVDIYYLHVAQTGIRTYITTLCDEINKRENPEFDYLISPDYEKVKNSRFFRGKTSKWKNVLFQLLYFIRKQITLPLLAYVWKVEIIFSPDILSPIWGRGKKVSVIHDTFFWDSPEHYQPHWLKYYLYFLEKGLKRNGQIITVTDYSKRRLAQIEAFSKFPVRVVYPASGFNYEVDQPIKKPSFDYFLHVGVMEKRKNLGMLILAFAELTKETDYSDVKLVLVGQRGPRETLDDYDHLQKLVREYMLEEKVIFTGFISRESLARYFQHALAYVFPSQNEGFGFPVLEAFSFGLPVIISRQGALMEVAGDAALVLETNTATSLRQVMKHLLEEQGLRKKLGEKGRKRLQQFSTEKFFLSLEHAFKEIVNG